MTTELSPERRAGVHLVGRSQGDVQQQEAFKLLWLLQGSRKGGQRDIIPRRLKATEAHMKRITPSFPGNRKWVYQAHFLGNGKNRTCDEMLSQSSRSSFIYKPPPPQGSACTLLIFSKGSGNNLCGLCFTFKLERKSPNLNRTSCHTANHSDGIISSCGM